MITSNATDVINRGEFEQFYEEVCVAEFDILEELASDIRSEGQDLVNSVLEAFKNEDLPLLQRSAHTLKSSTKIFGGAVISQQAAEIERLSNPEAPADFATVSNAISQLEENFSSFLLHLDTIVESKKD